MKLLLASATVLVLAACGSESRQPSSAGAEVALAQFLTSLEAGDCDAVKKIVVTPATVDCELVGTLGGSFADAGIDLDAISLQAGKIVDNSSIVTIGYGTDEPDETWDVERIDGSWRVVFDSEE